MFRVSQGHTALLPSIHDILVMRTRSDRLTRVLALCALAILCAADAGAAELRVSWSHPGAARFRIHLSQPGPGSGLAVVEDVPLPGSDDAGVYRARVPVPDAFSDVRVVVTAFDGAGRESDPSNEIEVSASEICGAVGCDDGIACTDDLCAGDGGCLYLPDDGRCPDGELCTDDVCDPAIGCRWPTNVAECNDGRRCTVQDVCFAGECAGHVDCPSGAICDLGSGFCLRSQFPPPMTTTTTVPEGCGDGVIGAGELCDDGNALWHAGLACRRDCTLVACGDPDDSGVITASDALLALRAAVGVGSCEASVCNVDGAGASLSAVDALRILRLAVGDALELDCPGRLG